ncbi:MAG TPA: hypothetical protein VNL91_05705 [Thermoanaerobaculia bacterium]|nr:hypothetical protein [Thermoanaerobaculia bacterium]
MRSGKPEIRNRKALRTSLFFLLAAGFWFSCSRSGTLTADRAEQIVGRYKLQVEPVYAEVPQRVWWGPRAPKDDFDEKALRTLRNLERAGLVTITVSTAEDGTVSYAAKTTPRGFPLLGTVNSARGPAFRAKICEKRYDGLRNFVRHPTDPTVGSAELVWHYERPTPFYDLFETKKNKPLGKRFASHIAFHYEDHQWRFSVTVPKVEAE